MAVADGRLVIHFGADTSRLASGTHTARTHLKVFNDEVERGGRGYSASSVRMLELGRAFEDAAAGFSTRGFQGVILGASNNIAQLATSFNPLLGGLVAIGGAAAIVASSLFKIGEGAKEAENKLTSLIETSSRIRDAGFSEAVSARSIDSVKEFDSALKSAREQMSVAESKLNTARAARSAALDKLRHERMGPDERAELEATVAFQNKRIPELDFEDTLARQRVAEIRKREWAAIALDEIEETTRRVEEYEKNREDEETRIRIETQKNIDRNVEEFEKNREQEEERMRGQARTFAERVASRLTGRQTDMTLTGSQAGTTAETSAIARALRMGTSLKDPTPEAIEKATKREIDEMKRHERVLIKIQEAAEKFSAPVGVPV